jgi:hypothetical protein
MPNQQNRKASLVTLTEGLIKKGGVNPNAPAVKPNFLIQGQKPVVTNASRPPKAPSK